MRFGRSFTPRVEKDGEQINHLDTTQNCDTEATVSVVQLYQPHMDKINPNDYRFFNEKGDPGFSPERNRMVIENSIKKYEKKRKQQHQIFEDSMRERTDAIATYLTSMNGSNKPVDKYFGRQWMAYLRGEQILETLKNELIVRDNMGRIIRQPK